MFTVHCTGNLDDTHQQTQSKNFKGVEQEHIGVHTMSLHRCEVWERAKVPCGDRNQKSLLEGDCRELPGMMEMFTMLTGGVVTQACTIVKTHPPVPQKSVHFLLVYILHPSFKE